MADPDFEIGQNDTLPIIEGTCKMNGVAFPITGATVKFHLKKGGVVKVNALATVVDGPNGLVEYEFIPGDTDELGTYEAEWEVTFAPGKIMTFPNQKHKTIVGINRELA